MPNQSMWNNLDREEAKPTNLNVVERRFAVRTNEGWKVPTQFADSRIHGTNVFSGSEGSIPTTELLVALPLDPSVTGVTATNFADRRTRSGNKLLDGHGMIAGTTSSGETAGNNFPPYFTCPFDGDSATAGGVGPDFGGSVGVSHDSWKSTLPTGTRLNRREVSSLFIDKGITNYIKVLANDVNYTNDLTISFSGLTDGIAGYFGSQDLSGSILDDTTVPSDVFHAFFGATGYGTNGIAVLVFDPTVTGGNYEITASVFDGTLTGTSTFTVTVG